MEWNLKLYKTQEHEIPKMPASQRSLQGDFT